jgi:hypothetical protein
MDFAQVEKRVGFPMSSTLRDYGYKSCRPAPDVWMKANTKPDGFKHWSYILVYTDDLLIIDDEPKVAMEITWRHVMLSSLTV